MFVAIEQLLLPLGLCKDLFSIFYSRFASIAVLKETRHCATVLVGDRGDAHDRLVGEMKCRPLEQASKQGDSGQLGSKQASKQGGLEEVAMDWLASIGSGLAWL